MANRFNKYHKMFSNFTGTDMLRLSRSDLIEMCGIADGLRLFYALHAKWVQHHAERKGEESGFYLQIFYFYYFLI